MTYVPDITDKRVVKAIKIALGFSYGCLSDKPTSWVKEVLDKNFGQQQNKLSSWLRSQLLICVDQSYVVGVEAKKYIINQAGADFLKSLLKQVKQQDQGQGKTQNCISVLHANQAIDSKHFLVNMVKAWTEAHHAKEVLTGRFVYEDKADRLWHPIQNIKSELRVPMMSSYGFTYDYDVVAAAPTLLLQHAQQLGCDIWLPRMNEFLADRQAARERIAKVADIPYKVAKQLLNSFFNGAKLGASERFSSFELLGHDRARVRALKEDGWLTEFREEIKVIWSYIEETMTRIEKKDKNGRMRKVPLNAKRKWGRYFELERTVMNSVRVYMKSVKCFYEHDGFKSKEQVDVAALSEHVLQQTGFTVTFERVL